MPKKNLLTAKALIFLVIVTMLPCFAFATGNGEKSTSMNVQEKSLIEAGDYKLPIVKEKMTISYAGVDTKVFSLNDNRDIWKEIEKKTNIAIDWQCIVGKDYNVAINLRAAAATDLPDIFETGQELKVPKLANDKVIIKTTELINKYAPNIKKEIKNNPIVQAMMFNQNGEMYSVFPSTKQHNEKANIKAI